MKLYHATSRENKKSIIENGLQSQVSMKISPLQADKRLLREGIFGFITLESALSFGRDNNYWDDVVVFEFEAEEVISDPEYDENVAMFVATDTALEARLVYEAEE